MCGCPVFVGLMTPMTILETRGDSFAALTAGIAASMMVVWLRVSLEPLRRPLGVLWATEIPRRFHSTALRLQNALRTKARSRLVTRSRLPCICIAYTILIGDA